MFFLYNILNIDFAEKFGIPKDNVNQNHQLIGVAEEFIAFQNKKKKGICLWEGEFRSFNGLFWEKIEKGELAIELGEFAEQSGVNKALARLYDFRNKLVKQLETLCPKANLQGTKGVSKLNLLNGTLWIKKNKIKFKKHCKEDYMSNVLPFDYDVNAKAPKLHKFLDEVLPEKDKQDVTAEFLGSMFDLNVKHEKILINKGEGDNGKYVIFELIDRMFGEDNISNFSLQNITGTNGTYRHDLSNKLLNYASETSIDFHAESFKKLASGEPIGAKTLYKNPKVIRGYARLAFNCNRLPPPKEISRGFFRRFLIIPYNVKISEEQKDLDLHNKILADEKPGILNWLLDGLLRLRSNGGKFTKCNSCIKLLDNYKSQSNSVASFMEDKYCSDDQETMDLQELYQKYTSYCKNGGFHKVNLNNFRDRVESAGFASTRRNHGYVILCKELDVTGETDEEFKW